MTYIISYGIVRNLEGLNMWRHKKHENQEKQEMQKCKNFKETHCILHWTNFIGIYISYYNLNPHISIRHISTIRLILVL